MPFIYLIAFSLIVLLVSIRAARRGGDYQNAFATLIATSGAFLVFMKLFPVLAKILPPLP